MVKRKQVGHTGILSVILNTGILSDTVFFLRPKVYRYFMEKIFFLMLWIYSRCNKKSLFYSSQYN
jgi:hypothetical protein